LNSFSKNDISFEILGVSDASNKNNEPIISK